jgi:hypothetical protein
MDITPLEDMMELMGMGRKSKDRRSRDGKAGDFGFLREATAGLSGWVHLGRY